MARYHSRGYRWHATCTVATENCDCVCVTCTKKKARVANPPITEGTATAKATGYAVAGAPSVSTPRSVRVEAT